MVEKVVGERESRLERVFRKLEKNLEFTEAGQTEDRVFFISKMSVCAVSFPEQLFSEQVDIDLNEYDKISNTMLKKLSEWREQGDTYICGSKDFRYFIDFLDKLPASYVEVYHRVNGLVFESEGDIYDYEVMFTIKDDIEEIKEYGRYDVSWISRFIKSFRVSDLRPYELVIRFPELSEDAYALVLQLKLLESIHCDFILPPIVRP